MKHLEKIIGLMAGFAMAVAVGAGVISSNSSKPVPVHASTDSGYTLVTMTAGTNGSACTVNSFNGIKVGTSKAGGDMSITVPSDATDLRIYAGAWKGISGLSLNITKVSGAASGTISPTSISLTADDGISNNSPFTLNGTESNFRFDFDLSNITEATVFKFTGSTAKRFVVWSAQVKTSTPAHTHTPGDPVEENKIEPTCTVAGGYDTVVYCTECFEEISRQHVDIPALGHEYEDGICIRCGAEEPAYFQILPSDGIAVTQADYSIVKLPITVSVSESTLTADQIRVFKNKTIVIFGTDIKKIVFTCTANDTTKYGPGCFAAQDGYSYSGKIGTWEGNSDSISFTASSDQVRITEIAIYITANGFASVFTDNILCNSAGTTAPTYNTGYSWNEFKTIYKTLDSTEKTKLISPDNQDIIAAMAKYDYIVGKYDYENFIGRSVASSSSKVILNTISNESSNNIIIITIITLVSLTSLSLFLIYRKKHQ